MEGEVAIKVQITGGPANADAIAGRYGFVNLGFVRLW